MTSGGSDQQSRRPLQQQPQLSAGLTPDVFVGGFDDALNALHKKHGTPLGYGRSVPGSGVTLTQRQQPATPHTVVLHTATSGATVNAAAAAAVPATSTAAVRPSGTNAPVATRLLNAVPTSAAAQIAVRSAQPKTGASQLYAIGNRIVSLPAGVWPQGIVLSIPEPANTTSVDILDSLPVAVASASAADGDAVSPTHQSTAGGGSVSLLQRQPAGIVRVQVPLAAASVGTSQVAQTTKMPSMPLRGTELQLALNQASTTTDLRPLVLNVNRATGLTVNVGQTTTVDSTALQLTSTGGWSHLGNQSAPIGKSVPSLGQAAVSRQASLPANLTDSQLSALVAATGKRLVQHGLQQQYQEQQQVSPSQPSRVNQVNVNTSILGGPTVPMPSATAATAAANATSGGDDNSVAEAEGNVDQKKHRNRAAAKRCREKKLDAMAKMKTDIESLKTENEEIRTKLLKFSELTRNYNDLLRQHQTTGECNLHQQPQQQQRQRQRRVGDIPET